MARTFEQLKDAICDGTITAAQLRAEAQCSLSQSELHALLGELARCASALPVLPPVSVMACDGSLAPVTPTQNVAILGTTAPLPVCVVQSARSDFEVGCSSIDGRTLILHIQVSVAGELTSQLLEADGVTPVADGSVLTKCSGADFEAVQNCFTDAAGSLFTQIILIQADTGTTTVVWTDAAGAVIAAPPGVTPCPTGLESDPESFCSAGTQLTRWTVKKDGVPTGTVIWTDNSGAVVPAPAAPLAGMCSAAKRPESDTEYVSAAGASTLAPSGRYREMIAFNRNAQDIEVTWTAAPTGGGRFTVPAHGTAQMRLTEEPDEGFITSATFNPGAFGTGAFAPNALAVNFKN